MILFQNPDHLPDVGYIMCKIDDLPAIILDSKEKVWANMCMLSEFKQLDFRTCMEPITKETGFLLYEPPNITVPILACDLSDATKQFTEMVVDAHQRWMVIFQFVHDGRSVSKVYGVEGTHTTLIREPGSELEFWDKWVLPNPEHAR